MNKSVSALLLVGIILVSSGVAAFALQLNVPQSKNMPSNATSLNLPRTFTSKQELDDFIAKGLKGGEIYDFTDGLGTTITGGLGTTTVTMASSPAATLSVPEYSETNIQVGGVDEADIVKTDGHFIYLASKERLMIVQAYPAEDMKIVSTLPFEGSILGLFINGDKLVIFEESGQSEPLFIQTSPAIPPLPIGGFHIKVYDVSERENPSLVRDLFFNGTYVNSRMIGDWLYVVANQPAVRWIQDKSEVILPTIEDRVLPATAIYYSNSSDIPVVYTLIAALDVQSKSEAPEFKVILTGYASTIYVSQKSIYVTAPKGETTIIHRIDVNGSDISFKASGGVPGGVLNQFSMDEHDGYFRIATTIGQATKGQSGSMNNLYILNGNLSIVGKLEDLAPGEQIHSARFRDDRCYLVTFKKVDPLFTIDVSKPTEPKILGKLKIPGYSDYLQPYDENHLIGIGKETVEAEEGNFAWYQGLKISLFDVSDIQNPKEVGKLIIGDRGTDSPVLRDHHALLFDQRSGLLVMPVLEAKIFPEKYPQGVPPSTYGEFVFQGVYILNISTQDGITVKGKVTHIDDPQLFLKSGDYLQSDFEVKRSLYIGENLYTISDRMIQSNNIATLAKISAIVLP